MIIKSLVTHLDLNSVINVVALSSEDYKIWVNGLQFLLEIGPEQAVQVSYETTFKITFTYKLLLYSLPHNIEGNKKHIQY